MKTLFSNFAPVRIQHPDNTFLPNFQALLAQSDKVVIAVGYVSQKSLEELCRLVKESSLKSVTLIMGMYYLEGISERTLKMASVINDEWKRSGIGEIRVVKSFKYHGKTYAFYKEGKVQAVIVGSANLSALQPDSQTRNQYEVSLVTEDESVCKDIETLLQKLSDSRFSANLSDVRMKTILDVNLALEGDENAYRMASSDFSVFARDTVGTRFLLPIKVPAEARKFCNEKTDYTKSNINVCYAAPRSAAKPRYWYEIQFTVPADVYKLPGYPEKNEPFFVATDDGYLFKVHTTSANNKQFNAVNDELTLGRWFKGRFVSAGLVKQVDNTAEDADRIGMITQEMLDQFGSHFLFLQRTKHFYMDPDDGNSYPLWILGFEPDEATR